MGKGIVRISFELIVQALGFPEGTQILGARQPLDDFLFNRFPNTLEVKLTHADLPPTLDGEIIRYYDPQFRGELVDGEHYETRFVSWNPE